MHGSPMGLVYCVRGKGALWYILGDSGPPPAFRRIPRDSDWALGIRGWKGGSFVDLFGMYDNIPDWCP